MKEENKKFHWCYSCHEKKECEWTTDPYSEDVEGDHTKHYYCNDCLNESAADI